MGPFQGLGGEAWGLGPGQAPSALAIGVDLGAVGDLVDGDREAEMIESGDRETETGVAGDPPIRLLIAAADGAPGLLETAAVAADGAVTESGTVILFEVGAGRNRPATVFSTSPAKAAESALKAALPQVRARARGRIVLANLADDDSACDRLAEGIGALPAGTGWVVAATSKRYRELLEDDRRLFEAVAIRTDRSGRTDPPGETGRPGYPRRSLGPDGDPLLSLALAEAGAQVDRVELIESRPGRLAARRALAGAGRSTGQSARTTGKSVPTTGPAGPGGGTAGGPPGVGSEAGRSARSDASLWAKARKRLAGERGQATPLALGGVFVLVVGAVALVAIAGAVTGKARAQRAVDLAAMSAAGSMREDLPRLLAPATLPNGLPNPAHMSKTVYLARARLAAIRIASGNGASPLTVSVSFPDRLTFAPVRVRVAVRTTIEAGGRVRHAPESWAEARVGAPLAMGAVPTIAGGGGYSGPLAERQGNGMRPDVAAAFDLMAAAAGAAGIYLTINSAFRSDAEQAALFAANPDPTWVARPGTSLHRCATELDVGPPGAYGWLAANASRFGFVQRYSWEPWHFGLATGPAPCSEAGNRVSGSGADPSRVSPVALPAFVPGRYRRSILAAAMKWNVSASLIAAQILAESNFDPAAVSPAGAQGIAQFMPGTAAAYGLRDPFDPVAAIDAQAHLMSDLLRQFGSPSLALAAYNAGPGAVAPCGCVPAYPETQAYVSRILALLGGVGAIAPIGMEVALVR